MENIFAEKLKKKSLTKAHKKIAEHFIANQLMLSQKSLRQVADEIGVSDASVLRFVREIGYAGYNALKSDLHSIISERMSVASGRTSLSSRFDISSSLPITPSFPEAFLQTMHDNIDKSFRQNNMALYDQMVEQLKSSEHKYIVGFRGGSGTAHYFARTLRYVINGVVEISSSNEDVFGLVQSISEKDVLIIFSFARYYKMDIEVCKIAQERKTKIFMITDNLISPVAVYADHLIAVETNSMSFSNSVVALNVICEYIMALLCRHKDQEIRDRLNFNDKYSEFLRT
ncbi:MAG: MurR/RpiR family transcriptional regulator [Negativicutes bacterium]